MIVILIVLADNIFLPPLCLYSPSNPTSILHLSSSTLSVSLCSPLTLPLHLLSHLSPSTLSLPLPPLSLYSHSPSTLSLSPYSLYPPITLSLTLSSLSLCSPSALSSGGGSSLAGSGLQGHPKIGFLRGIDFLLTISFCAQVLSEIFSLILYPSHHRGVRNAMK